MYRSNFDLNIGDFIFACKAWHMVHKLQRGGRRNILSMQIQISSALLKISEARKKRSFIQIE